MLVHCELLTQLCHKCEDGSVGVLRKDRTALAGNSISGTEGRIRNSTVMEDPASIATAVATIRSFIEVAKNLAGLPKLASPQYEEAARGLFTVCKLLQMGNRNVGAWLTDFRYKVDFNQDEDQVRTNFFTIVANYKANKSSQLSDLDVACNDIYRIYNSTIKPQLGTLIPNKKKREEAEQVFVYLSIIDRHWLEFVEQGVIGMLDKFVDDAERKIRANNMDGAARSYSQFLEESTDLATQLEEFTGALTRLMNRFADISGTPVTVNVRR
jgi:hypothetical protein